jgi:polyisoprenoid-binding protein YceI
MMRRALVVAGLVGMVGAAGLLGGMRAPSSEVLPAAGSWNVDAVHSSVVFRIKHMNTSYFYGHFNELTGTVAYDDAKPDAGSMDLSIKIESVDTHNQNRNNHLKSASFFNAAEFPNATFKSTSWKKSGDNAFDVTGDMNIHGQTKPVTIKLEKTGQGKGQQGEIIGFETTFTIKRSDFGITYMPDGLSDEVKLMVSIEAKGKGG